MSSPQKRQKSLPAACFASQGPPPTPANHVRRKDPKNAGLVHNVPGWKWMKNCKCKWCWFTQLSAIFLFFLLSAGHLLLQQGNICTRVPDSDSARVWWQPTKFGNHQISRTLDDFTSFQLVGGFNLLYLKNISQLGSFPQVSRDKYKHKQSLKTTT